MLTAFVDTNVLVYAADESASDERKTRIARELLRQPGLHLSVQVLNEFTVNARHRSKLNFTVVQENDWMSRWLLFPVSSLSVDTFLSARLIHSRYQLSHWDSLIVASALETGCGLLYSEDLGHGQLYDGVKVMNPFI
ncbi:MAG: PIN domain-containing protein [Verrucomicrobiaceae bacterium]|nr:MAG: PIN domain-containing protein [Verrucomicrobiaceae bacterium]